MNHSPDRRSRSGRPWSEQDVLDAIRAWSALYGSVPAMMDWDMYKARRAGHDWRVDRYLSGDWPSARTVCARFGNFSTAVASAGLEPRPRGARQVRTSAAVPSRSLLAVKTDAAGYTAALSARVRDVAAAQTSSSAEDLRFALFGLARQSLAWAQALEEAPDQLAPAARAMPTPQ